jgi:hypothetical protein
VVRGAARELRGLRLRLQRGGPALGAPDTFPRDCDCNEAWASEEPDLGAEWITVAFPNPVDARSIVVVETFNPGAVVRVDDVSEADAPVLLWEGTRGFVTIGASKTSSTGFSTWPSAKTRRAIAPGTPPPT